MPDLRQSLRPRTSRFAPGVVGCGLMLLATTTVLAQRRIPEFEQAPIHYSRTASQDAVAKLLQRLTAGGLSPLTGSDQDILRTVLRELEVPIESQVLVFAKASMQASLITPRTPRALYFNDTVYVGWVPDGLIEVAAIDPELGPVFYAFDPQDARDAQRTFVRESSCLRCHGDAAGRDIPGLFARSTLVNLRGELLDPSNPGLMDDRTPFGHRWSGWYVTGFEGAASHRGNAFATLVDGQPNFIATTTVASSVDLAAYLTDTSDIRALLVFEHQLEMHNTLTRASHQARRLLADPASAFAPTTDFALNAIATTVVDRLLFQGAAPLPSGGIGDARFRDSFAAQAARDRAGQSLRDFAATDRLFANRCSFLIYSATFRNLPAPLQQRIFSRLDRALRETDGEPRYDYLEAAEKRRIRQILTDTVPAARDHFAAVASAP